MRQDKADRSNAMAKLRKKEKEVQEILEEGETLSKRQHEAEQQIKKLKGRVKEDHSVPAFSAHNFSYRALLNQIGGWEARGDWKAGLDAGDSIGDSTRI